MQLSKLESAQVGSTHQFGSTIPPGAIPKFNVLTVTHPNLFSRVLNPQRYLIIRDDQSLGLVGETPSTPRAQPPNAIPNQSVSPTLSYTLPAAGFDPPIMHSNSPWSSADQPQAGPSFIPDEKVGSYVTNHPHSSETLLASGSRKILMNIQPGQGKPHSALDSVVLDGSIRRRQGRSKDNRQQPYQKKNKRTPPSEGSPFAISYPIPSSTIPTSDDVAKAQANFRTLQTMICPMPVEGQAQPCGQFIDSAKSMSTHLPKHGVRKDKRSTANSDLDGECPLCPEQVSGGSIHRHVMEVHFYRYICPVEGCHHKFPRDQNLRDHIKTHGLTLMFGNEDFAVRK